MSQGQDALDKSEYSTAQSFFERALELEPKRYDAWLALSKALYFLKDYPAAIQASDRAEGLDPFQAEFADISRAMQSRQFQTAARLAKSMLDIQPGHPRAVFTLSHLFQMQAAYEDQIAILEKGLIQNPANLHLRKILGKAQQDAGDIPGAIQTASHLLELEPNFTNSWARIGLFIRYGFNEEAIKACGAATALCDGRKDLLSELDLLRGHAFKTLGDRTGAIAAYRTCLANKPESGAPWWALADMKTYRFEPEDIETLTALTQKGVLQPEQQCQALFALAKAHEMESGLSTAMPYYKAANAAHPGPSFNPANFLAATQRLKSAFNRISLHRQGRTDNKMPRPIFIIGLPRSGSTLLEQILASHSMIEGTMELPVLPNIKRKMHLMATRQYASTFLDSLDKFTERELVDFGETYLRESAVFRTGTTPFFIDKLPNNFEHVGLIHKILPDAIILDIRRNPMDCGLSLFKQFFARGVPFSYNLEHIGTYYSAYLEIMDYWDDVLPARVFHIQYEKLVQNLEPQLRQILQHIGLDFETACLEFHKNKRAVRTASSEQVRQPLFKSGIGAWKMVKDDLRELEESLIEP